MIGSIIGAGISAAGGLASAFLGKKQNDDNLKFQKENLEYQKALQQQIFEREDTAHQREVDDLRKAGLNPLLSTGSGAQAGSVVPTEAPQSRADYSGIANGFSAAGSAIAAGERYREDMAMKKEMQQEQIMQMRVQRQKIAADTLNSILGYDVGTARHEEWLATGDYRERQRELDEELKELDKLEKSGRISSSDAKERREEAIYKHNIEYAKEHDRPYGSSPSGTESLLNMLYRLTTGENGDAAKQTNSIVKGLVGSLTDSGSGRDQSSVDNVLNDVINQDGMTIFEKRSAFEKAMNELGLKPTAEDYKKLTEGHKEYNKRRSQEKKDAKKAAKGLVHK